MCVGNKKLFYRKERKSPWHGAACVVGPLEQKQGGSKLLSAMHCQKEARGLLQDAAGNTNLQSIQEPCHACGFSLRITSLPATHQLSSAMLCISQGALQMGSVLEQCTFII